MKKITVIGGDKRLKIAEKQLRENGFSVDTLGLYDTENGNIADSDVFLLPVPTTKDGETVFSPFAKRKIFRRLNQKCRYTLFWQLSSLL